MTTKDAEVIALLSRTPQPTLREMGAEIGIGHTSVAWRIDRMEERGLVKRTPNSPRAIRVLVGSTVAKRNEKAIGAGHARVLVELLSEAKIARALTPRERHALAWLDAFGGAS